MKILFYRYGSICEEDILQCFNECGHEVVEVTEEITNKNVTFKQSVEIVNKYLESSSYDCIFTINFYPALSDLCNIYRIRYIRWIVDSPVLELFAASIKNPWNRIFLFDREQYNEIFPLNEKCVFHYPLAVNSIGKQKVIENAKKTELDRKYRCDVSFVGSLYTEKSPYDSISNVSPYLQGYMDGIMEAQLNVYGYYFIQNLLNEKIVSEFKNSMKDYYCYPLDNYLSDEIIISQYYVGNKITSMERLRLIEKIGKEYAIDVYTGSDMTQYSKMPNIHFRGRCKTETEMPVIFNVSRININPTSKAIRSGVPLRVFDIMACGGFLLSNYQTELCELFVPGEDFVYYDSIDSVNDIIAYYLEHDDERREIAYNGYRKVCDKYSYINRLNGLLLKAFET